MGSRKRSTSDAMGFIQSANHMQGLVSILDEPPAKHEPSIPGDSSISGCSRSVLHRGGSAPESWPQKQVDALVEQARAFNHEPGYYYFATEHANYLLPKWGGKPGETAAVR